MTIAACSRCSPFSRPADISRSDAGGLFGDEVGPGSRYQREGTPAGRPATTRGRRPGLWLSQRGPLDVVSSGAEWVAAAVRGDPVVVCRLLVTRRVRWWR